MSETRRDAFARAFIKQARSDWAVYRLLAATPGIAACHQLHYLQMACEKLAKAYRLRDEGVDVDETVSKHTGFEKFIAAFLLCPTMNAEYRGKDAQRKELLKSARSFARAIERLAPAIDRTATPENAEYPWEWEAGKSVVAPCEYEYPTLSLLEAARGRTFLNLLERAFRDFEKITL